MNVSLPTAAVALASGAFLLGRAGGGPAFATALVLGLAGASAVHLALSGRARRLGEEISTWLVAADHRPLTLRGESGWRDLGDALNVVGSALHRHRAADADRRARTWHRELVESLVQPALLFSAERRLLAANDAARELLGIAADATGLTVLQSLGSAALAGAVQEAHSSREMVTIDARHADRDLRCVTSVVGDSYLVIIDDRTRERQVEELRRNFVVNASHELKTPVTSIQTLAEALEVAARRTPERVPALVARLGDEARRLARLVGDLLDLRRLEERAPMERAPVDLAELVRDVVAAEYDRAAGQGIELAVDAPDRAFMAGVVGDLTVIAKNLVGNAIQYNRPSGNVEVSLRHEGGVHVLVVSDTGIGIPQQDLTRIFERFYRVDLARSRETGGTGLGLSIVRHAVERHGGTIRVESLLGEGTTFTVRLPIDAGSA